MTLAFILLLIGIGILRIEGTLGFIFGAGFVILAFILSLNVAIVNPDKVPHKKNIAKVSKTTKKVVKQIKDEIDDKKESSKIDRKANK
jgi:hypothetical protein